MRFIVGADNPGGANAVLPVVKQLMRGDDEIVMALGGKARDIFKDAKIEYIDEVAIGRDRLGAILNIKSTDIFLFGTSLGGTIEKYLLPLFKAQGAKTVCVLDSWVNYWQRFDQESDINLLPDYICVMDARAKNEMEREGFPSERLIITGNPFFDDFVDGITADREDRNRVLVVSQPLREAQKHGVAFPYDEYMVMEHIARVFNELKLPHDVKVAVRLHPRDEENKFNALFASQTNQLFFYDTIPDVKESISQSGLIIGMNSMVLFQAAVAGKTVISYQPGFIGTDSLVSNGYGLSLLITTADGLREAVSKYFTAPVDKQSSEITAEGRQFVNDIKNKTATNKVVQFLNQIKS
ncbi:MAG: hypothetical protein Q7S66_03255 [bacterium]|nr:hypothetical protein [bacterium]